MIVVDDGWLLMIVVDDNDGRKGLPDCQLFYRDDAFV